MTSRPALHRRHPLSGGWSHMPMNHGDGFRFMLALVLILTVADKI